MPNGMYGGVRGERKTPLLDCYKTLILAARRSGSFPEQSNKMNERSVAWRQTIKLSIFITESRLKNRFAAGVTKKVRSLK